MTEYNHNTNQLLLKKGLELLKSKENGYGQTVGRLQDGDLGLTNDAFNQSMADFAKKVFEDGMKRSLTIINVTFASMDPSMRHTKGRGVNIELPKVFSRDFTVIRNALHGVANEIDTRQHSTEIVLTEPDMSDLTVICSELADLLLRDDIKSDTARSHNANVLLQILADIYPGDERHLLLQYNTYEKENASGVSFITEFTKDDPRLVSVH